jgi:hypothetical protein
MPKLRPTINWLRKALLVSIMTHPSVREPDILYPGTDEVVSLDRGRLFGGVELIEPGLTVSVHPYHSSFNVLSGKPTSLGSDMTAVYDDLRIHRETISEGLEQERGYSAKIRLMVQLFYRDPGLNVPISLTADVMEARSTRPRQWHGVDVRFYDDPAVQSHFPDLQEMPESFTFEVQTLPGEEVLTLWLDLLKDVIRDVKVLYPFSQYRFPTIIASDYPTTTWLANSGNLIFHTAYHIVEFEVAEPPRVYDPDIPAVQRLYIVDNLQPM